jgi:hypothetical protein
MLSFFASTTGRIGASTKKKLRRKPEEKIAHAVQSRRLIDTQFDARVEADPMFRATQYFGQDRGDKEFREALLRRKAHAQRPEIVHVSTHRLRQGDRLNSNEELLRGIDR